MSCAHPAMILMVLTPLLLLNVSCGKKSTNLDNATPEEIAQQNELDDIYRLYSFYVKRTEKAPQQLSDIVAKDDEIAFPVGVRALNEERVIVVWGVDVSKKESGTVVAYEKGAPKQGGAVLMADGKIKKMSADDLKSAIGQK